MIYNPVAKTPIAARLQRLREYVPVQYTGATLVTRGGAVLKVRKVNIGFIDCNIVKGVSYSPMSISSTGVQMGHFTVRLHGRNFQYHYRDGIRKALAAAIRMRLRLHEASKVVVEAAYAAHHDRDHGGKNIRTGHTQISIKLLKDGGYTKAQILYRMTGPTPATSHSKSQTAVWNDAVDVQARMHLLVTLKNQFAIDQVVTKADFNTIWGMVNDGSLKGPIGDLDPGTMVDIAANRQAHLDKAALFGRGS